MIRCALAFTWSRTQCEMGQLIATENKKRRFASLEDFRARILPGKPALRILAQDWSFEWIGRTPAATALWQIEAPSGVDELPLFAGATPPAPCADDTS